MARKQSPAAYTVTAQDVAQVVQEHALEWEATAYFIITLGKPDAPQAYVDLTLRDGVYQPAGRELERIRYPLDPKHAERWPANILHAVLSLYQTLEGNPWNWPAKRRRAATGE